MAPVRILRLGVSERVKASDVTAVIPTRGDVELAPLLATLPYDHVVIWDGSRDGPEAYGMFVRWLAMDESPTRIAYTQDDDCLFAEHEALLEEYRPGTIVTTYGHGENPDGLEDFPLLHGGAIMDVELSRRAFLRYDAAGYPRDEAFYRYADLIVGGLTPFVTVDLPFTIDYAIAAMPNRMAHMDGARDLKHEIAARVRSIRGT